MSELIYTPNQQIQDILFEEKGIELWIKREDLIHPEISGNKWRKLKYNIVEFQKSDKKSILTFGGAFSNHIAATAAAGKLYGIKTIGIIRGEEASKKNPTLSKAIENGMELHFITRDDYHKRNDSVYLDQLNEKFENPYIIPEGGANKLGVNGCMEILDDSTNKFQFICCACGTGSTMAGIIAKSEINQQVIGFPSLKGATFLENEIKKYINESNSNWHLNLNYHFGGYAKITEELKRFVSGFFVNHQIQLDYVYTGKMAFGIYDMIRENYFPKGSKILMIHTGGIQGNLGIGQRFSK